MLRRQAFTQVKSHPWLCMGAWFLSILPQIMLMFISFFVSLSLTAAKIVVMNPFLFKNQIWFILVLYLIIIIITYGPINRGLARFYMTLAKGEKGSVEMVFEPFSSISDVFLNIRTNLLMTFYGGLWAALIVGVTVLFFLISIVVRGGTIGIYVWFALLYGVAVPLFVTKYAVYQCGWLAIERGEAETASKAVSDGKQLFRGRFWSLYYFLLSVIIWILLPVFLNIGLFFISMRNTSFALSLVLGILWMFVSVVLPIWIYAYINISRWGLCLYLSEDEEADGSAQPVPGCKADASAQPVLGGQVIVEAETVGVEAYGIWTCQKCKRLNQNTDRNCLCGEPREKQEVL